MTKTINPDVAAFKEDFFKGLSFREFLDLLRKAIFEESKKKGYL